MHNTLETLPPLDTLSPLNELPPLEDLATLDNVPPLEASTDASLLTERTFDALLASAAAAEPDSTEAAEALVALVREKLENGEVDIAIQQVMALGATACMHSHLEDLANELGEEVMASVGQSHGSHAHEHDSAGGRSKKDKKRRQASVSLAELLAKYPLFSKENGKK